MMKRILIEDNVVDLSTCSYGFPWKSDVPCFNFNVPQECVTAHDINNIDDRSEIETLVIGCNLNNYDFISDMINLKQLYIYKGDNVSSLDFVSKLLKLKQLYIVGSHISELDALCVLAREKERLFVNESNYHRKNDYVFEGICIETDRDIDDAHKVLDTGLFISELIINNKLINEYCRADEASLRP